jgi:hypothetical protein
MEKRNKIVNGVAGEVASVGMHKSAGIDERLQSTIPMMEKRDIH